MYMFFAGSAKLMCLPGSGELLWLFYMGLRFSNQAPTVNAAYSTVGGQATVRTRRLGDRDVFVNYGKDGELRDGQSCGTRT
jgi:hypothetical protein